MILGGGPSQEQPRAASPPVSDLSGSAPTLPPLDIGNRGSKTFDETSYHLPSPAEQDAGTPPVEPTTPVIEISDAADDEPSSTLDPNHLSNASSLQDSSVLDHFPEAPTSSTDTRPASLSTLQGRYEVPESQDSTRPSSMATARSIPRALAAGSATRPTSLSTLPGTSQKRYTLTDAPQRPHSAQLKRTSSLLASRDADLFTALNRALEGQ